ncbi:hypothetical protein FB451DRAFT_1169375 [Mycena latifolia]|nr:hypothetical protein FB451DRAFT_1169375 [Mycena latifolia]
MATGTGFDVFKTKITVGRVQGIAKCVSQGLPYFNGLLTEHFTRQARDLTQMVWLRDDFDRDNREITDIRADLTGHGIAVIINNASQGEQSDIPDLCTGDYVVFSGSVRKLQVHVEYSAPITPALSINITHIAGPFKQRQSFIFEFTTPEGIQRVLLSMLLSAFEKLSARYVGTFNNNLASGQPLIMYDISSHDLRTVDPWQSVSIELGRLLNWIESHQRKYVRFNNILEYVNLLRVESGQGAGSLRRAPEYEKLSVHSYQELDVIHLGNHVRAIRGEIGAPEYKPRPPSGVGHQPRWSEVLSVARVRERIRPLGFEASKHRESGWTEG